MNAFTVATRLGCRVVICLSVTAAALCGTRVAAAGPQTPPGATAAPTWLTVVDTYRSGRHVEAAVLAGGVDPTDLVIDGRRHIEGWREETTDEAHSNLKASAALAFELALVHLDGESRSRSDRYLGLGADALRALERSSAPAPQFAALWRLAGLHYLLLSRQHGALDRQAQRDDVNALPPSLQAEWHIARGVAHETSARLALSGDAPRVQQTPFGTTAFNRELWIDRARQAAVDQYRAAVAADPTHLESRLRLGRVLFESGKADEARAHLQQAATDRCSDAICGLAWLFLGDLHAAHGTTNDSRRAYLRASRVLAARQSALIGLLRVTMVERPAAALEMTRQFDADAMLGLQRAPDAWSRYLAGNPLGFTTVVSALRTEAGR